MSAVPSATAVTTPERETVATAVLLELHTMLRPVSVAPFASTVTAVACVVPTAVIEFEARDTVTEATGTGTTLIDEDPGTPSLLAVIVARPTAWAVTSPFASTDAIALSLEDHTTARPVRVVPVPSFVVAVSCWVAPTMTLAVGGLTVTDATGTGVTVRSAEPLLVSLVALILAVPAATAVTNPLEETVATPVLSDDQVITLPVKAWPLASRVVAVACVVCPATTEEEASETLTVATGIGVTVTGTVANFPSLTAAIVATPGASAETIPLAETVATAGLSELQSINLPLRTLW